MSGMASGGNVRAEIELRSAGVRLAATARRTFFKGDVMTNPDQELDATASADLERASQSITSRLDALGIDLDGTESPDELTRIADAVERFEDAVEARGGDLMVDEPPAGSEGQPDHSDFVLPRRAADETVAAYVARLDRQTERIAAS
jgi:hypothetical protein